MFVSMRNIKRIQGEVIYGFGTMSVVINFTVMDFFLPYIVPLMQVSEWVSHALVSMATIVTGECVLCGICAIGVETFL
jgi:multisubunit Na+/H+ antiporter MnhB subunit